MKQPLSIKENSGTGTKAQIKDEKSIYLKLPDYVIDMILSSAAAVAAKSIQLCPTPCNPIDGSPPGSPIPGIPQARTLEWVVISFSKNMLLGSRAKFRSPKTIAFNKVQLHICLMTES